MSGRKVILSMQITLDGYVSNQDDTADWLINSDENWQSLFETLESIDTFIIGRKTYPVYSTYWRSVLDKQGAEHNELKFAKMADKTQHIVFTKGSFKPELPNYRAANDLMGEINRLKKENGKDILAWGGAGFASSLIELDLVDEFRFELNPTILTKGKSLFSDIKHRKNLKLINVKAQSDGLSMLRYVRK